METILIVDDEKNYTLILSAILEDEGLRDAFRQQWSGGAGHPCRIRRGSGFDGYENAGHGRDPSS